MYLPWQLFQKINWSYRDGVSSCVYVYTYFCVCVSVFVYVHVFMLCVCVCVWVCVCAVCAVWGCMMGLWDAVGMKEMTEGSYGSSVFHLLL